MERKKAIKIMQKAYFLSNKLPKGLTNWLYDHSYEIIDMKEWLKYHDIKEEDL
jgi:hypothetical protein